MAIPADYVTGTLSVTNGSTSFTGTGTGWALAGFREGDTIIDITGATEYMGVIATIDENGAGTLTKAWEGPTLTDVAYRMRYQPDGSRVAAQARQLIELLGNGNLQAVSGLEGSANQVLMFTGPGAMTTVPKTDLISGAAYDVQVADLAARAAYDGQAEGYAVLVSDTGDGRSAIYSKVSATSGDWSDPAYVTGAGYDLSIGTVEEVPYGQIPAVTLTPDSGGGALNFEIPAGMIIEPGTISTLPPGSAATIDFVSVTGGYRLDIGIPQGATGSIENLPERISETFAVAPSNDANLIIESGWYRLESDTANLPPGMTLVNAQPLLQLQPSDAGSFGGQIALDRINGRLFTRGFTAGTPISWRTFWNDDSLPEVSQAAAEAGTGTTPKAWSEERVAQAIAALAPEVPADVYRRSNAIGTVSESSGVPTGAIIERGSNANGEYVRYADGTQICWFPFSGSASGATVKTFPAAFANSNFSITFGSSSSTTNAVIAGKAAGRASVNVALSVVAEGVGYAAVEINVIVIGRWF